MTLSAVEMYLPVAASGILFTGGVIFALAARELRLPIFRVGTALFLVGFLHAAFDSATIAVGAIGGHRDLALQFYRLEQLFATWLIPLIPCFVLHVTALPKRARKLHKLFNVVSLGVTLLITLVAFLRPDLFVSVTLESPRAETLRGYWGHGRVGPLFVLREAYIVLVLLYTLLLILWVGSSSRYRFRESGWLTTSILLASVIGVVELTGDLVLRAGNVVSEARLDRSLLALSFFCLAGMVDTARRFLSQAKIVDRTRRDLQEKQKALEQYLYSDILTGLPNREALNRDLEDLLGLEEVRAGLVLMDIDDFQGLNESLGTSTVDRLLSQIARIVRRVESSAVAAYRTGTDEFALLIRGAQSSEGPSALARQIQGALLRGFYVDGQRHSCGASAGILMIPEDGSDIQTISKHGFSAIRRAKQQRNSIMTYDESMRLDSERKMRLVSDLRQSVSQPDFYMVYQPLVGRDLVRLGVEALMRWDHPGGERVSPGRFIPAAEEAGLMKELGSKGIEVLCADLRRLAGEGEVMEVSLNLSAYQFGEPEFPQRLAGALGETGYPLPRLVLELTESAFVGRMNRAIEGVEYLSNLGFRIAMDDFGTGYSSLSSLRSLPLDRLKVDRSFVEGVPGDERSEALLRVVRETCTAFGLEMVAEGVERADQLEALSSIAPDLYQGYYFGRPATLDEILSTVPRSSRGRGRDSR